MEAVVDVVLHAGRSAVDVSLYTLLPIMVVLMILMRVLEAKGVLDQIVAWLTPLTRPFGLPGMGVLAMIQISFISFVAPLPTMALMEDRGTSNRHLAATLAAVLAMAPANATFPLIRMGVNPGVVLTLSAVGGVAAAASTYWALGRRLSAAPHPPSSFEKEAEKAATQPPSLLKIINIGGAEAIQIVIGIIPMLLLSLVVVTGLENVGAVDALARLLAPVLGHLGINQALILPTITKYLAGSTALVGVVEEMAKQGHIGPSVMGRGAGFLLHPLDVPGVAILISAGPRLSRTWRPAVGGACIGIALRVAGTALLT